MLDNPLVDTNVHLPSRAPSSKEPKLEPVAASAAGIPGFERRVGLRHDGLLARLANGRIRAALDSPLGGGEVDQVACGTPLPIGTRLGDFEVTGLPPSGCFRCRLRRRGSFLSAQDRHHRVFARQVCRPHGGRQCWRALAPAPTVLPGWKAALPQRGPDPRRARRARAGQGLAVLGAIRHGLHGDALVRGPDADRRVARFAEAERSVAQGNFWVFAGRAGGAPQVRLLSVRRHARQYRGAPRWHPAAFRFRARRSRRGRRYRGRHGSTSTPALRRSSNSLTIRRCRKARGPISMRWPRCSISRLPGSHFPRRQSEWSRTHCRLCATRHRRLLGLVPGRRGPRAGGASRRSPADDRRVSGGTRNSVDHARGAPTARPAPSPAAPSTVDRTAGLLPEPGPIPPVGVPEGTRLYVPTSPSKMTLPSPSVLEQTSPTVASQRDRGVRWARRHGSSSRH